MLKQLAAAFVVGLGLLASGGAARADDRKVEQVKALWPMYEELRDGKKYAEAITVLDEILKLQPKNTYAWSEGAYIFNELGQHDAAMKCSRKSIDFDANNASGWRELGYALMMKEELDDAAVALATAIQRDSRCWHAYDYLAQTYEKQGKFASARKTRAAKAQEMEKAQK